MSSNLNEKKRAPCIVELKYEIQANRGGVCLLGVHQVVVY
jgi:hypothetical protein